MQKDLKIGLLLGIAIAAIALVYLATRPSVSVRARLNKSFLEEKAETQNDKTLNLK